MSFFDTSLTLKGLDRQELDYPLLASALARAGYAAPTKKIHDLVKAGVLIGVKKGLYVVAPDYAREPVVRETLANLIYGPSCISLESALSYHELIPERVEDVTSVTPKKDKRFETPLGVFSYRYLTRPKCSEGIQLVWLDAKHPVLMASPEKALCDYVTLRKVRLRDRTEAKRFLFEDLRMEPSHLNRLDPSELRRLSAIYGSTALDHILPLIPPRKGSS